MSISTQDQMPASATDYYKESVTSDIYTYRHVGVDCCGRKVYQPFLDGEEYGQPRSLLKHSEFVGKIKHYMKICPGVAMGVQRWTTTVY